MKVSFLHTLSTNQVLFAPYIETFLARKNAGDQPISVSNHVNEELLKNARQISNAADKEQVTRSVHRALKDILKQENNPDMIVCTCSTIGDMAEALFAPNNSHGSSSSGSSSSETNSPSKISTKILRVDRPMAETAVQYPKIHVLAALESTIEPTLELLKECADNQRKAGVSVSSNKHAIEKTVIPGAWSYFQDGNPQKYAQAIADYILETYQGKNEKELVIVLAQASMPPAVEWMKG